MKGKIVEIVFMDYTTYKDEGYLADEEAKELRPSKMKTYGILREENEDFIVIHMIVDTDAKSQSNMYFSIDKSSVLEINELKSGQNGEKNIRALCNSP